MGKSYAEKVKAKQSKTKKATINKERPSKKETDRSNKFPVAPVVVVAIVITLIVASLVLYQVQNDDGGDGDPNSGNNGINGDDAPGSHPQYSTIALESLDGGIISLDQYHGKVVLIDMFATWCGPCADQMGELIKLQNMFSRDELVILSVDTDLRETKSDVRSFMSDYPEAEWTFAMSNSDFNNNFPASSIPTMFILDKDLEVAGTEVGVTSVSILQQKVQNLL
jgi:thiol-disulfide isomerase/thioredoxin